MKEKVLGALRSAKDSIRSKLRVPKLRHAKEKVLIPYGSPAICGPVREGKIGNKVTLTMRIVDPDDPEPIEISIQGPKEIVKGLMAGQPYEKKPATRRKGR